MTATIAALYVDPNGTYAEVPGLDIWDEARDARKYDGPFPVVAHPPCSRWCRLAGLVEARWGHKRGDDGGTFAAALRDVRRFGGVLEHPAYSDAFAAHGLATPVRALGWQRTIDGGFVAHVEQGRYGHPAKKATWLYAFGMPMSSLPSLNWRTSLDVESKALVSWCGNHTKSGDKRERVGKKTASSTPVSFRTLLLQIAGSAYRKDSAGTPVKKAVAP